MKRANWYAMRDAGGCWPQMFGPYSEERARAEAARLPGGFVVGFAGAAERGDFLRRWEDGDARARGLAWSGVVALLDRGEDDEPEEAPGVEVPWRGEFPT